MYSWHRDSKLSKAQTKLFIDEANSVTAIRDNISFQIKTIKPQKIFIVTSVLMQ